MNAQIVEYKNYVMDDVLGGISNLTVKSMFGGFGIYYDGIIFAIITDEPTLRFKVDDTNRNDYVVLDSKPFIYSGHKNRKPTVMNYYEVPVSIMEDSEKIYKWVMKATLVSKNSKKRK